MANLASEMSALIAKYQTSAPSEAVPAVVAPKPVKPKRVMSEAQLASLAKGRETRIANALAKKQAKTSALPANPLSEPY